MSPIFSHSYHILSLAGVSQFDQSPLLDFDEHLLRLTSVSRRFPDSLACALELSCMSITPTQPRGLCCSRQPWVGSLRSVSDISKSAGSATSVSATSRLDGITSSNWSCEIGRA